MKTVKRLSLVLLSLGILALGLFQLPAVQDGLFRRAVSQVISRPRPYRGAWVVVCGSASPLGNSPSHAQPASPC